MTETKLRNNLYDTDFFAWTREQARLLRDRRFSDIDLENLIDEVESVGASEKREIRNRLEVLLAHLLKWRLQPGRRTASWRATIREQRGQLAEIVADSPSLQPYLQETVAARYAGAVLAASRESGIAIGLFPEACPFTAAEVLDDAFLPEDKASE